MEGDPFAVIEGMAIAALRDGRLAGYVYVRGEYPEAAAPLAAAIAAARDAGYLGEDVLGSGWSFEIEIRRGAGAYIAGEETALFEFDRGRRGRSRATSRPSPSRTASTASRPSSTTSRRSSTSR